MRSLLVLSFLAFYFVGYGQIIDFPDANFKNALVNTKCVDTNDDDVGDADADLNDDGEIDVTEANTVKGLRLLNKSIQSLSGIENFKNLTALNCNFNKLTSLDLKELKYLESLFCYRNQLASINVQGLINLATLACNDNKLTSLNLQGLLNLKSLFCINNQLPSLDVNGLIKLEYLDFSYNQITSIDLKGLLNLKNLTCSKNQLNSLDIQGLLKLENLTCHSNILTSLDVKGMINLKTISCFTNQLTSLDVKALLNLNSLECSRNNLTSLDVKDLIYLRYLSCSNNKLTSLDIKSLIKLEFLYCDSTELTSLDLKGFVNLRGLGCSQNKLTSLDIKELIKLEYLTCHSNLLTSLDLKNLIKLKSLRCFSNQLSSLDLDGLIDLQFLYCDSTQLTSLNIKNSKIVNEITFSNNAKLKYICCNDEQINGIKEKINSYGLECEANSYCSFTPGGKFYTLDGQTTFDYNYNGCDDLDAKLSNTKYKITNGTISGDFISNTSGNYQIPLQEGTHTITPIIEYLEHFEVTPSSYIVTFPSTSDTITQNFCITPKGIFRQKNITVIPLSPPARPGFDAKYKIVWENVGNQIENGTLNFTYDETLLDYITATQTADQIAEGIVKWNFTNLLPFEKREITVTFKVNKPTDTPPVNVGDKLYLTAYILNEFFTLENTVVGSYDPNDKTCLQGDRVHPDMIGKYVDYLIRFENTGNYAAENVVVKDIIDTKIFDVSSLQITDASHEVYTHIEGNKVEFIFENIQLPFDDANNDGYIAFKIKTLPTLVLGDSLKNLADIYFDYNFPIRTNEAQTKVAFPVFTIDITTDVHIYPNPVKDVLYIDTNENWTKAEIYDISGRIMRSVSLDSSSIDVGGLESGTYFMRVKDGEKVGMVKFVKI